MKSDQTRQRILDAAARNFLQHGFSRVSMDSLVAEVRTSKSTIYKYFASKADLVQAVLEAINAEINTQLDTIITDTTLNFQEQLSAVTEFTGKILTKVRPEFLADLQTYTPDLWESYLAMRQDRLENLYGRLFDHGIAENIVRDDVPKDLILLVYTKLTELAVEPDALAELPMSTTEAYATLSMLFLDGVLTTTGRRQLMES